jgi:hypothetical protein
VEALQLPHVDATTPQWGDGFEIETLINVRVAAHKLNIAEICSYEASRIHGVSNLHAVRDGTRVLRTIIDEFRYAGGEKMRAKFAIGIRNVRTKHAVALADGSEAAS